MAGHTQVWVCTRVRARTQNTHARSLLSLTPGSVRLHSRSSYSSVHWSRLEEIPRTPLTYSRVYSCFWCFNVHFFKVLRKMATSLYGWMQLKQVFGKLLFHSILKASLSTFSAGHFKYIFFCHISYDRWWYIGIRFGYCFINFSIQKVLSKQSLFKERELWTILSGSIAHISTLNLNYTHELLD